jgi:hypothetical protein
MSKGRCAPALGLIFHAVVTHALLLDDIFYESRLYRALDAPIAQTLMLGTCFMIVLPYLFLTLHRGHVLPSLAAAGFSLLVIVQMLSFSSSENLPLNFNIFFQYIWVLTFVPFAGIALAGMRTYLLRWTVIYATIYCFVYVALNGVKFSGLVPAVYWQALVLSDIERGDRLFLYTGAVWIAYFYWLTDMRLAKRKRAVFFYCIAALAIGLSLSRVAILLTLALTIAFIAVPRPAALNSFVRVVLLLVSGVILYGVVDTDFNPFAFFSSDSSGSYRAMEYEILQFHIGRSPLTGFGIASSNEAASTALGHDFFFASDLGAAGVWFDFGLFGLLTYLAALWLVSKPARTLPPNYGWALFLTGCIMTAYGCMAPIMLSPGGAATFGLIAAMHLAERAYAPARPSPAGIMPMTQHAA